MAKPLQVQLASSSKPSFLKHQDPSPSSYRLRQRGHRASRKSPQKVGPSSSLLTLLASLASASTVYGSPAPPSFLCPGLESGDVADCPLTARPSTSQTPVIQVLLEPTQTLLPRHVPDRYSPQADGVWRRVDSYTLYGSTMPAPCTSPCPTTTAVASPMDDQIQVGDTPIPSSTTSAAYDISTDLPPGWKPIERPNRTVLILLTSLFLALFICSFIIGSMFWRKRMKTKKESRDIEAKANRKRDTDIEGEEGTLEKEIKTKQKIWARATARWRSNTRYAARQRRGRRISSRLPQANHSTTSLDNSRSHLTKSSSAPPSRLSSRRSSTASLGGQFHSESIPIPPSVSQEGNSGATLVNPEPSTRVSPPAYQHHGEVPHIMVSGGESSSTDYSGISTPIGMDRSRRPSHSSALTSLTDASNNNTPMFLHAAHVATDDKALLARLAMFASAPPEDGSEANSGSALQISAPEWEDEPLEDIAPHLVNSSTSNPFSVMFPPPPSKERLAAAEFYDYSYAFEDIPMPLEAGPSAPPFEEGSSPQQDLVPSAPPLFEDDEFVSNAQPSAPSWDSSSHPQNEYQQMTAPGDGDRGQLEGTTSRSTDRGLSSTRSPVRDSIVLPGYQP